MTRHTKKYWDMTKAELAEATKEFDKEFSADKARPMTPAERSEEKRARRGRPKIGKGSQKIHITVERTLLAEADKIARQKGLGRSELIAQALVNMVGRKAG
jgi:hypothetical protein